MNSLKNKKIFKIITLMGLSFLYFPILILIFYSFNASNIMSIWGGFSFKWYYELTQDEHILKSFVTSIKIAVLTASLSCVIGTILALYLNKKRASIFQKVIFNIINVQFTIPEIIIGLSLLLLFVLLDKVFGLLSGRGITTVVIAHASLAISYVTLVIKTKLDSLNYNLIEAASDLGARPITVFSRIILPLIFPSIINGWFLAFILSMDDLVIASFTSGPGSTTLPILIHSRIRMGISPEINALATVMIVGIILIGLISNFAIQNKKR